MSARLRNKVDRWVFYSHIGLFSVDIGRKSLKLLLVGVFLLESCMSILEARMDFSSKLVLPASCRELHSAQIISMLWILYY
jgi:hypothetical protein